MGLRPSETFSSTEARNIIGCWNTIITPLSGCGPPLHKMRPAVGVISPHKVRSNTLLPAPLGPSTRVMPSLPSSRSIPSSTTRPEGSKRTPSTRIGNMFSAITLHCPVTHHERDRIEHQDHRDQHHAQRNGQRQIAL